MARHSALICCFCTLCCAGATCQPAQDDGSCDVQAHGRNSSALLQVRSHRINLQSTSVEDGAAQSSLAYTGHPHTSQEWKSDEVVSPALHYFKWWAAGEVRNSMDTLPARTDALAQDSQSLDNPMMVQVRQSKLSAESLGKLLGRYKEKFCPEANKLIGSDWKMYDSHEDNGVRHLLMRSAAGKLQYAAIHSENVLASDPAVCLQPDVSMSQQSQTSPEFGIIESVDVLEEAPTEAFVDTSSGVNATVQAFAKTSAEANGALDAAGEARRAEFEVLANASGATAEESAEEWVYIEGGCHWQCYLNRYSDLQQQFGVGNVAAAEQHYNTLGQKEGRDCTCPGGQAPKAPTCVPKQACDWLCYLNRYDDLRRLLGETNVAAAEQHYCAHGEKEGRDCSCDSGNDTEPGNDTELSSLDDGGDPELLDVSTDPLVADCIKLVHRVAKQRCGKDFSVRVLSATMQIIDGFAVKAIAQFTTANGTAQYHDMECDFELPNSPDASLLQVVEDNDTLNEEKDGLEVTLRMEIDVCEAERTSSTRSEDAPLLLQYSFGHLPAYKGYGHLEDEERDKIPVFLPQRGAAPATYSMKRQFPECFPKGGSEIVRNQGTCGSCWAFAVASALMTNLCAHGRGGHALASRDDRYEVSVQGIMSCNSFQGGQKQGCNGGHAQGADTALSKYGIGKERDFVYKCGGGRPEDHFDKRNVKCTSGNGWGARCSFNRNPNWVYGGLLSAGGSWNSHAGEQKIMQTLVGCGSGYISFTVYANFMQYRSGIYQSAGGGKRGGHAVTLMGYGSEGGTKYWWILNSWGTNWGNGGYVNFLRGRNLADIESSYYCIKGTVKGGGRVPPSPPSPTPPSPTPPSPPGPRPPSPPSPPSPPPPPGIWSKYMSYIDKIFYEARLKIQDLRRKTGPSQVLDKIDRKAYEGRLEIHQDRQRRR